MLNKEQFEKLLEKLDILIKLTAMNALNKGTLTDQIEILSVAGLKPKQIAMILGTDSHIVRQLKYLRKKQKRKKEDKSEK